VLESPDEVRTTFIEYFAELFSAGPSVDRQPCMRFLHRRVSPPMNEELLRVFTKGEVLDFALKQMGPLKAPGPNDITAGFFQHHLETMGEEVSMTVLEILNSGMMPPSLNLTYIALIPKVKNPLSVTNFRPISLCNVLYKLISKVLANSLKKILPYIISPTQSAFIPSRLIMDNILVAYETLHTMHS
jgi:hypothetical protein